MAPQFGYAEEILGYFEYEHLRHEQLKAVSKQFHDLAHEIVQTLPRCPERTVALRKLLEGKDAAVRAALPLVDRPTTEGDQHV